MKLFILLAIFGVSVLESSITGPPQIVRFTRHRGPFHSFGTKPPPVGESLVKVQHSEKSPYRPVTKQPTFYKHAKPFTINPWGPLFPNIHYTKEPLNLDVTKKPPTSGLTPKEEETRYRYVFKDDCLGGLLLEGLRKITVSPFKLSGVVTKKDKASFITKIPHIEPAQVDMAHVSVKPYPRPTYRPRVTKTLLTHCPCCHFPCSSR